MGFFNRVKEFFMGLFDRKDMTKVTGIHPQIGDGMMTSIELWRDIYGGQAPWLDSPFSKSSGFAKTVCRDIATKCTCEGKIETGNEDTDRQFVDICSVLPEKVEKILALGASVARPYYDADTRKIELAWYPADRVVPLTWHGDELRSVALLDFVTVQGDTKKVYVKVETHVWDNGSTTITSKAFEWNGSNKIGNQVPLSTVKEWEQITEEPVVITGIEHPLFSYIKTPIANNVDGTNTGVSLFANAVDQIEALDKVFSDMDWEREAGSAKVYVADSMIPQKMVNGKPVDDLSAVDKRLYKKLDGGVEHGSDLFEVSTPAFRFDQYKTQMDTVIALACKNMALDAKSFLVDRQGQPVTAEQILSEKNETYTTVLNLQEKMLKPALYNVLDNIRVLQKLYSVSGGRLPESNEDITISFGDSILVDEATEKNMALNEVQKGLRSKMSYLIEYRGLSEEEAIKEIERIKSDAPTVDYFGDGMGM